MSGVMDIGKISLEDVKVELSRRGLDTTGRKSELLVRLVDHMENDTDDSKPDEVDMEEDGAVVGSSSEKASNGKSVKRIKNKHPNWGVTLFQGWLVEEKKLSPEFEQLEASKLDHLLSQFYGDVRKRNSQCYGRRQLASLRNCLNRHLWNSQKSSKINIKSDEFSKSCKVFEDITGKLKAEKSANVSTQSSVLPEDFKLMYTSQVLSCDNPVSLQRKVFVEIATNFGPLDLETMRQLTKTSFICGIDPDGRGSARLVSIKTKGNQQTAEKQGERQMFSQNGNPDCPIASLEKFLSKLHPTCPYLFTYLALGATVDSDVWYSTRQMGKHTLSEMMRFISMDAGLSQTYTYRSLQVTDTEQ